MNHLRIATIAIPNAGKLSILPCPPGGSALPDAIAALRGLGVTTLVSMLSQPEMHALEMDDEPTLCAGEGIAFIAQSIVDRSTPDGTSQLDTLIAQLTTEVRAGQHVAVHCRLGIGRSGMMGACILVGLGFTPDYAIFVLSRARGIRIPDTADQEQWIFRYAERYQTK